MTVLVCGWVCTIVETILCKLELEWKLLNDAFHISISTQDLQTDQALHIHLLLQHDRMPHGNWITWYPVIIHQSQAALLAKKFSLSPGTYIQLPLLLLWQVDQVMFLVEIETLVQKLCHIGTSLPSLSTSAAIGVPAFSDEEGKTASEMSVNKQQKQVYSHGSNHQHLVDTLHILAQNTEACNRYMFYVTLDFHYSRITSPK